MGSVSGSTWTTHMFVDANCENGLFTVGGDTQSIPTHTLWACFHTCVLSILSCTMPSFSSSLIRSVVSCSRPIRLIFPLFWTFEFFLGSWIKQRALSSRSSFHNCREWNVVSHEGKLLVDEEQRSLRKVFGRRHHWVIQQHLPLEFGERHQRLGGRKDENRHQIDVTEEREGHNFQICYSSAAAVLPPFMFHHFLPLSRTQC